MMMIMQLGCNLGTIRHRTSYSQMRLKSYSRLNFHLNFNQNFQRIYYQTIKFLELMPYIYLVIIAYRPKYPLFTHLRPSYSSRCFQTEKHSAAERHADDVTDCTF